METTTTYPADADPAEPIDSRRSTSIGWETAARQHVHRLIRWIRRGSLVRSNLLASILIAAVTPVIQSNPVIMRSTAGRE